MPEALLAEQFPRTPLIFPDDDLIDTFFKQRAMRQTEIEMANELLKVAEDEDAKREILNVAYPQKFDACNPGWGKECVFRHICFGHNPDPLTMGYVPRYEPRPIEPSEEVKK